MERSRKLIERITRSWVFRRELPSEFCRAPMFVSPSAGLKFLFNPLSKVDPPLLRNVLELVRKGDIVWDIGANVGLFTFAAASISGEKGKIVSFEPDPFLVQLLRKSKSIQSKERSEVEVVPAGVASEVALRRFHITSRSRAYNSLSEYGKSESHGLSEDYQVAVFNLDWLLDRFPAPDLIKCDVEGAELEVFINQARMLGKVRPVIITEVSSERSSHGLTNLFKENGYKLYDAEKSMEGAVEIPKACFNTLAIPNEKSAVYLS
jgi:FkbM family methyltransferase